MEYGAIGSLYLVGVTRSPVIEFRFSVVFPDLERRTMELKHVSIHRRLRFNGPPSRSLRSSNRTVHSVQSHRSLRSIAPQRFACSLCSRATRNTPLFDILNLIILYANNIDRVLWPLTWSGRRREGPRIRCRWHTDLSRCYPSYIQTAWLWPSLLISEGEGDLWSCVDASLNRISMIHGRVIVM